MALTYFKRYRMEIDLRQRDLSWASLAPGYRLLPWDSSLLEAHAEVKFLSFRDEIDANVFPCFGELAGCIRLMTEISHKQGFLPDATWLAVCHHHNGRPPMACGTVQGIRDQRSGMGAIQNLGITPPHRKQGLGSALMCKAFDGFRQAGLDRVFLEVTAENSGAIRLYRRLGYGVVRTVFKAAEVAFS
ncbi:MAG: GNAT family N-acetyltransferase [Thermoguttaceae bacterium]